MSEPGSLLASRFFAFNWPGRTVERVGAALHDTYHDLFLAVGSRWSSA
jgi:hypothetical protein